MIRTQLRQYQPGTAEYVALHGEWSCSRGRAPSATLPFELNPRRALRWANRFAYFPKDAKYLRGTTPANYVCGECGVTGVKLWREYQTMNPDLCCARCAAKLQKKNIDGIDSDGRRPDDCGRTDQIGWFVPAVPTEEGDTYWGYTSVPQPGCDWWRKLPTLSDVKKVI